MNDEDDVVMFHLNKHDIAATATSVPFRIATSISSFDIMTQAALQILPNANNVLAFLHTIFGLCQQVRDRPRVCIQAHTRLYQTYVRIANAAKEKSLPVTFHFQPFIVVLNQLKALLDQHLKLPHLVAKVTASRRLLSGLAQVHSEINVVLNDNSLTNATTSALLEWKQQFALNRLQDEKALHDTLMALLSTPTFVSKEFPSKRSQALVLLELVAEFAVDEPRKKHSSQLLETLKMTHGRISDLCDLRLRRVPRWFLAGCQVSFSSSMRTIGHSRGSFGSTLQRGEAYRYSYNREGALCNATSTVAVKCLWALPDIQYQIVEQLFARSGVFEWTRVRHPNIVTVRGASHVAIPPYLVRDFTTYGGLTSYLAALETRAKTIAGPASRRKIETLTWQLLYGASRGLLHLHEQHSIVHGGLRCNNILVDKKGRAVIADFGLYTLACDARDSGLTEYFQLDVFDADAEELIRWQAPECLREHVAYRESLSETDSALVSSSVSASATSFSTDVYAFGMCILEALTRTVPWAGLEIAKIRTLKENLSLLPSRPRCISSQGWTLIEKMCAADPKKRITLSEASQELKRLGYGNRVSKQLQTYGHKDSEKLGSDAAAKVDRVSSAVDKVSLELVDESSSSESSATELKVQDSVKSEHVSTSLDEAEEAEEISDRCCNESASDMGELEVQATQKLACVSSIGLNIASQERNLLGLGHNLTNGSQNSSDLDLVAVVQEEFARLTRDDSGVLTAGTSQETLSSEIDEKLNEENDLLKLSAATSCCPAPIPVNVVEQLTVDTGKQVYKHVADSFAPSDASTVKQTGRPTKTDVSLCRRRYSDSLNGSSGVIVGHLLEKESSRVQHLSVQDGNVKLLYSREAVCPVHGAIFKEPNDSDTTDDGPDRNDSRTMCMGDSAETTSVTNCYSKWTAYEQLEKEVDSNTASVKSFVADDEYLRLSSSADEDERLEQLTVGDSSLDEEALMIVPGEFQTSRSFDEGDFASPLHPVIGLLDSLWTDQFEEEVYLVETLEAIKKGFEMSTALIIMEREGFLALMKLVWKDYSEVCTIHALEILQIIAGLSSGFMATLVEDKLVKILLAVVKYRSSSRQVDLAASFLLEVIADNDEAKRQLWKCRGVGVMEDSRNIDRRLVQEVKSTMAKFKRNEGLKCLEDGEYHLAIDKFTEAIALDRKRAAYYGDRSVAHLEASMLNKAVEDAYRCIRYSPYDVTGYLRHGLALKALGKYEEAIQSLRKGTEVDPKFVKIHDTLIETEKLYKAQLNGGAGARMLRHMTTAELVKDKKKNGDDALRKKDFALAVECYAEALKLDPKNDWVYLHRSIAHIACKDYMQAIDAASMCIRLNHRQVEGYYRLALALHGASQYDEALNTLYRGQEVDPRHVGIARFINQLEEEEAMESKLSLPEWYKNKGYRAFQLRSYEDAIKFYTKAINASQSNDDEVVMHCYLYRSRANQTRGEFSAVIADCTYVLERCPTNAIARLRRADSYEQQRNFVMALQDLRELATYDPEYEDVHARLELLEQKCRLLPDAVLQKKDLELETI